MYKNMTVTFFHQPFLRGVNLISSHGMAIWLLKSTGNHIKCTKNRKKEFLFFFHTVMKIFSSHGVPWSALETTHVVCASVCLSVTLTAATVCKESSPNYFSMFLLSIGRASIKQIFNLGPQFSQKNFKH